MPSPFSYYAAIDIFRLRCCCLICYLLPPMPLPLFYIFHFSLILIAAIIDAATILLTPLIRAHADFSAADAAYA